MLLFTFSMDKQKFIKADSKEEEFISPSPNLQLQGAKKLTLGIKPVSRGGCRFGFYFYRNFLISLNILYLVTTLGIHYLIISYIFYLTADIDLTLDADYHR